MMTSLAPVEASIKASFAPLADPKRKQDGSSADSLPWFLSVGDLSTVAKIRRQCWDNTGFVNSVQRSTNWQLLLGYLHSHETTASKPSQTWTELRKSKQESYYNFVKVAALEGGSDLDDGEPSVDVAIGENYSIDHPLNHNVQNKWKDYFFDTELLVQISKDCQRLHGDIGFFHKPTPHAFPDRQLAKVLRQRARQTVLPALSAVKSNAGCFELRSKQKTSDDKDELHWHVLERILFVYCKLNTGQTYAQGMNELIAPLYYVLCQNPDDRSYAESDCFFCFISLMDRVRDNFAMTSRLSGRSRHSPDDGEENFNGRTSKQAPKIQYSTSVHKQIRLLNRLIKEHQTNIYYLLIKNNVHTEYFAFKWLTVLFAQEFSLNDLLYLWDMMLCVPVDLHAKFVVSVAFAMVSNVSKTLATWLENDNFAASVKLLQHPSLDVKFILNAAKDIFNDLMKVDDI